MKYNFSEKIKDLNGTATREIFKLLSRPEIISFAGGLPATECIPVEIINKLSNEILSAPDAIDTLQYGVTDGVKCFRQELINFLADVGINAQLEEVLAISGGQQGIDLMFRTFINDGDNILVEDPTYLAFLQIAKSYKANAYGVKSNNDGLDLEDLENKIKKYSPKMLYIVPTFSNPTGKTYSLENRKAIIELAQKYDFMILEDDPYSRLRFEGENIPSVKSLDKYDRVVYLSSFSKILSPGLRVGVATAHKDIIRKMTIAKQGSDVHTSALSQMIAYKYMLDGYMQPNINKSLPIYLNRKNTMIECIDKFMPDEFSCTNPQGGLFIWGEFDANIDTASILPEAIQNNVAYIQGNVFYADEKKTNTIRLNYSNANEEKIYQGIKSLGNLFKNKIMEVK